MKFTLFVLVFFVFGTNNVRAASASDNFNRADGSLGSSWTAQAIGGMAISSQVAVGANAGGVSGSYWNANSFGSDQFSEIKVTSTPLSGHQWLGATVRNQSNGDLYLGIYYSNFGTAQLRMYKYISGNYTQLGASVDCGALPPGTALRLVAVGTSILFLLDGRAKMTAYDGDLAGGAPGIMAYDQPSLGDWTGGHATSFLGTDANGVESYISTSANDGYGPHVTRILRPNNPASGMPHNFLYALPVEGETDNMFGDPMATLWGLDVPNQYNLTIIVPAFATPPWYADHPTDPNCQYETYMVSDLVPWVTASFSTTGTETNWLLGFSKSGVGGVSLILKHPDVFSAVAAWDFPARMSVYDQYGAINYGTNENFQANYRLTQSFVDARKAPFVTNNRIWISGFQAFQTDISDFDALLTSEGILHTNATGTAMPHHWDGGWVPDAVAGLHANSAGSDGP